MNKSIVTFDDEQIKMYLSNAVRGALPNMSTKNAGFVNVRLLHMYNILSNAISSYDSVNTPTYIQSDCSVAGFKKKKKGWQETKRKQQK